MKRFSFSTLSVVAVANLFLGGCGSFGSTEQAAADQPMAGELGVTLASERPTFGVGDELGWLAFGDLALAPMPGEPTDVLVIAKAEPMEPASFDWVGQYLALAD